MNRRFVLASCVALGVATANMTASAQAPAAAKPAPVKPTPRAADGHPDLNGVWRGGNGPVQVGSSAIQKGNTTVVLFPLEGADPFEGQDLFKALDKRGVARKAAVPNKPPYKPELMAKVKDFSDRQTRLDPAFYCKPEGVPRMGPPNQIVQTPGQVVFLYEGRNAFRVIPTDGRPHRQDVDPSWMGDSIGRWDGDTLVIDVTQITDESWLDADGWFHSDKMHVVERLKREGDVLTYSAIAEDPDVFTKPWELTPRTLRLRTDPTDALVEPPLCIEKDGPHLVTDEHH
jgi:hypothetical protein